MASAVPEEAGASLISDLECRLGTACFTPAQNVGADTPRLCGGGPNSAIWWRNCRLQLPHQDRLVTSSDYSHLGLC
jgi:hypothetical protein